MDQLLKHALDDDAVGFIGRFKDKMGAHLDNSRDQITREVVADMTGTEVQESTIKLPKGADAGEISDIAGFIDDNEAIGSKDKKAIVKFLDKLSRKGVANISDPGLILDALEMVPDGVFDDTIDSLSSVL